MLHLIFQSPIDKAILERMADGDVTVFLGDSVFGILLKGKNAELFTEKLNVIQCYVLSEDMAIRGVLQSELIVGVKVIDYAGLVKLTVEIPLMTTWC